MTIENPCTVIKFPVAAARLAHASVTASAPPAVAGLSEGDRGIIDGIIDRSIAQRTQEPKFTLSEAELRLKARSQVVGHNERLRAARNEAWKKAEAKLNFWRAWEEIHSSIRSAHRYGVLDQVDWPATPAHGLAMRSLQRMNDFEQPWILDNKIRDCVHATSIELLLTPASRLVEVQHKQKELRRWRFTEEEIRQIERAIADDEAWLKAHPARQSDSNKRRRKKAAVPSDQPFTEGDRQ